jgi:hypothetical protein
VSFVFWAALAITGLVVGPIIAHMLRRGRANEREFPAAALVPPRTSTARQRSRLEDWPLLALRALLVVGLSVLGAAPLVRCERLSLSRTAGASVAFAIVLDDSLSMRRAPAGGRSRFERAHTGALELLASARDGDAVAIVLAGRPSRIALSPTTDLSAARRALKEIPVSDRSTDLTGAVQLARSTLHALPQKDHRVVVLSDFAGDAVPEGSPEVSAPLRDLAEPSSDCAVASAERHGTRVVVSVACSDDAAARSRTAEVVVAGSGRNAVSDGPDAGRPGTPGDKLGASELSPRRGEQTVTIQIAKTASMLDVHLAGTDADAHDDTAPVAEESLAPAVAVVADAEGATASTGGPTVLEQALHALGDSWIVRPLPFVPDDAGGLRGVAALVLDDPRGLSPEARTNVAHFVEQGGVAAALMGPRAAVTELGWTLEPFARGAARWEPLAGADIDVASVAWLGPEAASLAHAGRRGRIRLDGLAYDDSRAVGKWSDGVPWLVERDVGRGLVVTAGVPSSLDESDFAVRPGFLAFLDHVLHEADQRKGSRRTVAGVEWVFPSAKRVLIDGPEGELAVLRTRRESACAAGEPGCAETALAALPVVRGRYAVHIDGALETRTVTVDPGEILAETRSLPKTFVTSSANETAYVAASREVALFLIAVFGLELALRIYRRWAQRGKPADTTTPAPHVG